jgi:carbon monoxide dehydrogenase subunit G
VEQSGEYRIAADINAVWQGLNDPDVLAKCIDGCQSMEKVADDQFKTAVKAKVGPVSATFQAELKLEDLKPPESYRILANVKGGAAGFGKGTAAVTLTPEAGSTRLNYQVDASVGGKLAQVGSRLIDGAARKMADDFFAAFGEEVSGEAPVPQGATAERSEARYESSGRWIIWIIMFAVVALAMLLAL